MEIFICFYEIQLLQRKEAINYLLYNDNYLQWFDYNLETQKQNIDWYPSNLFPLWSHCHDFSEEKISKIIENLISQKIFHYPAGIPTSIYNTTKQQWDFPNAWPPLQYLLINSLNSINSIKISNFTLNIIQKWITTNYCSWKNSGGYMFEKYDVTKIGKPGEGGEYQVQTGFGWTNGVVLYLLQNYGEQLKYIPCP
jgi:alpha,alpha-trehalase